MSWAEWKAAALNRQFEEQGVTGEPSRITAATALHGERRMSEPNGVASTAWSSSGTDND
jgi:hypothetical protein